MNKYIFITNEGYTYQPNSESSEPDCENAQVLGIGLGNEEKEALKNLLEKYKYLKDSNFNEVYCYKLDEEDYNNNTNYFSLKQMIT